MKKKEIKQTDKELNSELDSIYDQATEGFINQKFNVKLKNKLKNLSPTQQFEFVINDKEECRKFCIYCLVTINGFVNHPETIKIK